MNDNESKHNSIDNPTDDNTHTDIYTNVMSVSNVYNKYYTGTKQTKPFLTKFERAKLIGIRAQMLSNGSSPLIKVPKDIISTVDIAELEFKEKKIPLFIKRYINDIDFEYWRLGDMVNI